MDLFAAFVAFLCLKAHGRDRTRIQTLERDWLASNLAIAIFAIFNTAQRGINLADQFALTVPRAQFERAVGLFGGAVGDIRNVACGIFHACDGVAAVFQKFCFPVDQLSAEVLGLALVHEWLIVCWTIIIGEKYLCLHYYSLSLMSLSGIGLKTTSPM